MAKDYAKKNTRNSYNKKTNLTNWVLGLSLGLLGMIVVVLSHKLYLKFVSAKMNVGNNKISRPIKLQKKIVEESKLSEVKPVKFTFYKSLTADEQKISQKDNVLQDKATAVNKVNYNKISTKSNSIGIDEFNFSSLEGQPRIKKKTKIYYILQLGLFPTKNIAARVRLNYLLAGVDTQIVREKTSNNRPRFRIQQGPFFENKAALLAKQRLQKKGFTVFIRKMVDNNIT